VARAYVCEAPPGEKSGSLVMTLGPAEAKPLETGPVVVVAADGSDLLAAWPHEGSVNIIKLGEGPPVQLRAANHLG
jgi:hypothetical protein